MDACNCFELDHATKLSCENLPQELQTLFASFNRMSERISFLVHEVFMKQKAQQETELQLLRTQINPHYLYNTLEIMHMKAYSHGDYDVSAMAELLGQNLQYGLRNTTKEVLLKEEISQLNIYLSILSYQFKDRIRTNICIEEELMECRVIKLLFQPVIENAVIHGITSNDQILSIDILGYRSENTILIQISDDGCGMTEKQLEALKNDMESSGSNGIGLRNVFRRIQLNYGPEYTLEVNSKYGLGTTITLHLPWQPADTQEEE
ncbi:histidine kinase [Clostridium sp. chh4-2]|uniref:sensor histidine kinase n=1 Tax=Clostridium sp. chh4-2 TaxID=2067550 RepID=UPI0015E199B1|nr:histidine kinase [Clostridium sp. chh4-2]